MRGFDVSHISDTAKHVGDLLSVGVVIGTLAQLLPSLAALLTILWTAARLYETMLNIRVKRRELGDD